MRCRERAAFGEAPTSRTRPGTSRRSIRMERWPGPARPGPGAARPAKYERSIARESTNVRLFPYSCGTRGGCAGHGTTRTAASMALHGRATSSRGPDSRTRGRRRRSCRRGAARRRVVQAYWCDPGKASLAFRLMRHGWTRLERRFTGPRALARRLSHDLQCPGERDRVKKRVRDAEASR